MEGGGLTNNSKYIKSINKQINYLINLLGRPSQVLLKNPQPFSLFENLPCTLRKHNK